MAFYLVISCLLMILTDIVFSGLESSWLAENIELTRQYCVKVETSAECVLR